MGRVYELNFTCDISPQSVMVNVEHWKVRIKSTYQPLTPTSFKNDVEAFASLMANLCCNRVPDDVQCLVELLKKKETWRFVLYNFDIHFD